jgi:hypothetical protein
VTEAAEAEGAPADALAPTSQPSAVSLRAVLAAVALALAVRAAAWPADRPLWLDEAIQLDVALADDFWQRLRAEDLQPPLMHGLQRLLASLGAPHDAGRWASALASLATVPATMALAAALTPLPAPTTPWRSPLPQPLPAGTAWRAGLLAALSAPLVLYAAEARAYALATFLATAALAALAHRHRSAGPLAALALASSWSAWPVVGAGLLTAVARELAEARPLRPTLRALLAPGLVGGALLVTVLPGQLAGQAAGLADGPMGPFLGLGALRSLPQALGWTLLGRGGGAGWLVGGIATLGLLAALFAPRPAPDRLFTVGPLALLAGIGLVGLHPLGPTHHLLPAVPALIALGAASVCARPWTWGALLGVTLAGLLTVRPLPVERVGDVLDRLADPEVGYDLPVVADASAAPQARVLGHRLPEGPWVRADRLAPALPQEPHWLLCGRSRYAVCAAVAQARGADGAATVVAEGAAAWQIPGL